MAYFITWFQALVEVVLISHQKILAGATMTLRGIYLNIGVFSTSQNSLFSKVGVFF